MGKHSIDKRIEHPSPWGPRIPQTREWYDKVRSRITSRKRLGVNRRTGKGGRR
jgi:hypothetical protein